MADLKIWASSSKAVDDPKALRAAIDAVLPRRNGYLDWRRSNDYARQGSAVMELLRPWISRDAATARELCEHALRRLFKVAEQSDDSLGGIGGLIQDLMGLLIETLRTAAPPASWIDRWFKLMDADPWGLWNEPAVLEAAGPEAQARYAERARQDWHVAAAPAQDHVPALFVISDRRRRSRTRLAAPPVSGGTGASGRPARATGRHDRKRGDRRRILRCRGILRGQELASGSVAMGAVSRPAPPRDARCEDALLRCYERDGWDEEALAIRRQRLEHHPGPMQYMALLRAAKTRNGIPLSIGPSCSHGRNNANRRNTSMRWNNIGILNSRTRSRHHCSTSPFACNGSWRKRNG